MVPVLAAQPLPRRASRRSTRAISCRLGAFIQARYEWIGEPLEHESTPEALHALRRGTWRSANAYVPISPAPVLQQPAQELRPHRHPDAPLQLAREIRMVPRERRSGTIPIEHIPSLIRALRERTRSGEHAKHVCGLEYLPCPLLHTRLRPLLPSCSPS